MTKYLALKVPSIGSKIKSVTTFLAVTALVIGVMATGTVLGLTAIIGDVLR